MILTDYYKMAKLPNCTAKLRIDCVASTGEYDPFEVRAQRCRDKRFKCYYGDTPDTFSANAKRKAGAALTDTTNISSVYTPDLDNPLLGYGDTVCTNDALLFLFREDYTEVEIFVARGHKHNQRQLFQLFVDGELTEEMERLRAQAKPTNAPTTNK